MACDDFRVLLLVPSAPEILTDIKITILHCLCHLILRLKLSRNAIYEIVYYDLAITLYDIFYTRKKKRIEKLEFLVIFSLVIFLFHQSKNNLVLEPRTGHFRGPVGFEAKDFSFEAKVKDFKMCPRGLHLQFKLS